MKLDNLLYCGTVYSPVTKSNEPTYPSSRDDTAHRIPGHLSSTRLVAGIGGPSSRDDIVS